MVEILRPGDEALHLFNDVTFPLNAAPPNTILQTLSPAAQNVPVSVGVLVRTTAPPDVIAPQLRQIVRELDASIAPQFSLRTCAHLSTWHPSGLRSPSIGLIHIRSAGVE